MVNLIDLKWLLRCEAQVRDMADDPLYAAAIVSELDKDPDLREQLSHVYVRAIKTMERSGKE